MNESHFRAAVADLAIRLGWLVDFHLKSYRDNTREGVTPGIPDLTLCRPPRLVYLELKMPGKQLSGEQVMWLEALREAGVVVYVFWYSDEVISEIVDILK
ncbi:hypothetical protein LCGC14_0369980 [marine sediment metagenome]|uniref:VRR-NUC domain-containing protein n=1 Tax=marine sediment metagenome TaxID=412755 RepID=A0A0F9TBD8_9ZZZZ